MRFCRSTFRALLIGTWVSGSLLTEAAAQEASIPSSRLRLSTVVTIGGDLADGPYAFHRIGGVESAATGEIVVLDTGARTVRVFDAAGRFLRSFGRSGGGPGEFMHPASLHVDTLVQVFDASQRRVSVFTLGGVHRETRPLPSIAELPIAQTYPLQGGGVLASSSARYSPGSPSHQPNHSVVYRSPARDLQTLTTFHSGAILWHPEGRSLPWSVFPSGFGQAGAYAILGDSIIAVADGYSGEVRWYRADARGLTRVRQARIPTASPAVSAADLAAAERRLRESSESAASIGRLSLNAPTNWSVASRAFFADDGALWIGSSVGAERGQVWTVFLSGQQPPRSVRLPAGFDIRSIRGNRMYGVAKTEFDAEVVRVYEWRWD